MTVVWFGYSLTHRTRSGLTNTSMPSTSSNMTNSTLPPFHNPWFPQGLLSHQLAAISLSRAYYTPRLRLPGTWPSIPAPLTRFCPSGLVSFSDFEYVKACLLTLRVAPMTLVSSACTSVRQCPILSAKVEEWRRERAACLETRAQPTSLAVAS